MTMANNIQLFNEDCEKTLERLEDGSVDLMLTDTPFGVLGLEWDIAPNLEKMWKHWERIMKPNGVWVFTATNPFASDIIQSRRKYYKHEFVINKGNAANFMSFKYAPAKVHYLCLVFSKTTKYTFNPIRENRTLKSLKRVPEGVEYKKKNYQSAPYYSNYHSQNVKIPKDGKKHPTSIKKYTSFDNEDHPFKSPYKHPTKKPLNLFRYLVKTYSNEGETVFDGYSGSGTTAIACIKENRKFIGAELNKKYYDKAQKRIDTALLQPFLF